MIRFERDQVRRLLDRTAGPPRRIHAVFGPRQSGKTTIVQQALGRAEQERGVPAVYATTDMPALSAGGPAGMAGIATGGSSPSIPTGVLPGPDWIVRRWEHARSLAGTTSGFPILVLDEIQKIGGWSEVVKGLWDADRNRRRRPHVVILGSAPLLMQSGLSESLFGRFLPLPVHHWSLREMTEAFGVNLPEYLFHGGYPGASDLVREGDEDGWRELVVEACLRPAVERDIAGLTRVNRPALLSRLLEMSGHYSGQIVSFRKLLGHLQDKGSTATVARYLDLLEGAGLVAGLTGYTRSPLRRRPTPKLLALNPAVMTARSGYDLAEARSDRSYWGRVVETAVGAHLFASRRPGSTLHYWRRGNHEVDFVLERGPHLLAIEVKSGPHERQHRGLRAFCLRYPRARTLLIAEDRVPLHEFLAEPAEHWLSGRWE